MELEVLIRFLSSGAKQYLDAENSYMEVSTNYSRDFDHIFGILPMGKYLSKIKESAFFRSDDLT